MKIYKNQTKENAKQNGFYANYEFASDNIMSPKGVDIMAIENKDGTRNYEVTEYDYKTKLANIFIMSLKELHIYSRKQKYENN